MTRSESWWPVARGGELVGYLTDEEHERLLAVAEPCTAEAGDLVFQKGSPSRSLLLVEEGQLEVFDESMGQRVVLARIGPGGVVGEVGFVDGQPRTHHVRARARCRLRRLSREALLGFLERDSLLFAKLAVGLAQLLTFRFRSAVEELEPVRSFAAALREPLDFEEVAPQFHELDAPLPEEDPDAGPAQPTGPAEAMKVMRKVARKSRKKGGSAGV
ncbi:MAG TPA: cyclic nucleotide-binding domain-containing protein [Vicinamibacteria bacterium]